MCKNYIAEFFKCFKVGGYSHGIGYFSIPTKH
jgi:hypothetical protein